MNSVTNRPQRKEKLIYIQQNIPLLCPPRGSCATSTDLAARIETVSAGTNKATYTYLANSGLIGEVLFKQDLTTRMSTQKDYDELNRLKTVASTPSDSAFFPTGFAYCYNTANYVNKPCPDQ